MGVEKEKIFGASPQKSKVFLSKTKDSQEKLGRTKIDDFLWRTVPAFTSVDEQESLGKLNIYPNPSQGVFQVNIPNIEAEPVKLEVFDMLGNLIVSERISNAQNGIVDLRSQANGSYLIRAIKDNAVWTGRLLKLP